MATLSSMVAPAAKRASCGRRLIHDSSCGPLRRWNGSDLYVVRCPLENNSCCGFRVGPPAKNGMIESGRTRAKGAANPHAHCRLANRAAGFEPKRCRRRNHSDRARELRRVAARIAKVPCARERISRLQGLECAEAVRDSERHARLARLSFQARRSDSDESHFPQELRRKCGRRL